MLQNERRVVPSKILGRLQSNMVEHEGTDDAVYSADAELVHILCTKALRDSEQKFNVFAVRWIPCILGLRSVVVYSTSQSLQS